jgi:hypothetical protein
MGRIYHLTARVVFKLFACKRPADTPSMGIEQTHAVNAAGVRSPCADVSMWLVAVWTAGRLKGAHQHLDMGTVLGDCTYGRGREAGW